MALLNVSTVSKKSFLIFILLVILCSQTSGMLKKKKTIIKNANQKKPPSQSLADSSVTLELTDYLVIGTKRLNFDSARAYCEKQGMKLLSLQTEHKAKLLMDWLTKKRIFDEGYLTSGTDLPKKDRKFYWDSTGEPFNYTYWGPGQPDNRRGEEHCVQLHENMWNDLPCVVLRNFICERKVGINVTLARNEYLIVNSRKLSFEPASAFCHKYGMKLLSLQTERKSKLLMDWLDGKGLLRYADMTYLTSGTDLPFKKRNFIWNATGEAFSYRNWLPHLPDNWDGDEHCVEINRDTWNDIPCSMSRNFICERDTNCGGHHGHPCI